MSARERAWKALWETAAYQRLHERQQRAIRAARVAEDEAIRAKTPAAGAAAARANEKFHRISRKLQKHEDAFIAKHESAEPQRRTAGSWCKCGHGEGDHMETRPRTCLVCKCRTFRKNA